MTAAFIPPETCERCGRTNGVILRQSGETLCDTCDAAMGSEDNDPTDTVEDGE